MAFPWRGVNAAVPPQTEKKGRWLWSRPLLPLPYASCLGETRVRSVTACCVQSLPALGRTEDPTTTTTGELSAPIATNELSNNPAKTTPMPKPGRRSRLVRCTSYVCSSQKFFLILQGWSGKVEQIEDGLKTPTVSAVEILPPREDLPTNTTDGRNTFVPDSTRNSLVWYSSDILFRKLRGSSHIRGSIAFVIPPSHIGATNNTDYRPSRS